MFSKLLVGLLLCTQTRPAEPPRPATIQVTDGKDDALKLLKAQGYRAVEVQGPAYTLPVIEITGPQQVKAGGRMIICKAEVDKGKLPANLIEIRYQWTVINNGRQTHGFLVWNDGSQIVFESPDTAGTSVVILDVDCLFGEIKTEGAGLKTYTNVEMISPPLSTWVITVVAEATPTPPTPVPQPPSPPPPPTLPAGQFGLAQLGWNGLNSLSECPPADRVKFATGAANGLDLMIQSIDAKVAAGAPYKTVEEILDDLRAKVRKGIVDAGSNPDDPRFSRLKSQIQQKLYDLYLGNQLPKFADYKTAFGELALGLRAYQ
jgi:hypothetical protein